MACKSFIGIVFGLKASYRAEERCEAPFCKGLTDITLPSRSCTLRCKASAMQLQLLCCREAEPSKSRALSCVHCWLRKLSWWREKTARHAWKVRTLGCLTTLRRMVNGSMRGWASRPGSVRRVMHGLGLLCRAETCRWSQLIPSWGLFKLTRSQAPGSADSMLGSSSSRSTG